MPVMSYHFLRIIMARNSNTTSEQQGKIRFMLIEVAGSNQTLQDSIKTISKAIGADGNTRTYRLNPSSASETEESTPIEIQEMEQITEEDDAPVVAPRRASK